MNKPIDPNLNNDKELDILGSMNDENADDVSIEAKLSDEHSYHHGSHHHSSHHHKHHRHHRHHRHHKKKLPLIVRILITILVIILAIAGIGAGVFFYLQNEGKNDMQSTEEQIVYEETIEHNGHKYVYNNNIVSIVFLGVDKRDINESSVIGTNGQADAVLVLTVDTKTGRSKIISVPRDTIVDVDLFDKNGKFLRSEPMQLCLGYAYGDGRDSSAKNTLTSVSRILYDIPFNKYFVLDLDGIAPINDAIGGVRVKSLSDFPHLGINEGDMVRLKGDMTEQYIRYRDVDALDSSIDRSARQVQYIQAFATQAIPAVMNDFSIINRLYETAMNYSTTNIDVSNVTYLASLLASKGVREFETETLKGEMKLGDTPDENGIVYAEFYVDENAVLETVLDTFYTQVK